MNQEKAFDNRNSDGFPAVRVKEAEFSDIFEEKPYG